MAQQQPSRSVGRRVSVHRPVRGRPPIHVSTLSGVQNFVLSLSLWCTRDSHPTELIHSPCSSLESQPAGYRSAFVLLLRLRLCSHNNPAIQSPFNFCQFSQRTVISKDLSSTRRTISHSFLPSSSSVYRHHHQFHSIFSHFICAHANQCNDIFGTTKSGDLKNRKAQPLLYNTVYTWTMMWCIFYV